MGMQLREQRYIYTIFVIPKLTYASPAESSSLFLIQQRQLDRGLERACQIFLGEAYTTYENVLITLNLTSLNDSHAKLLR